MTQVPPPVHVSVVAPVHGCQPCLERLVDGIAEACSRIGGDFEVVLVDDASPDGAWQRICELVQSRPWLHGVRLSRNFGQHAAISTGIARARGQWVVVMDCDLQDSPAAIPGLYEAATSRDLDVVFGLRTDRQDSLSKRASSWLFYRTLAWLTGVPQDPRRANFGIFRRPVIDAVVAMPERERFFPLMVTWVGFRTGAIAVEHAPRSEGRSSYTFLRMLRLATQVALGYSDKPLRLVAVGGLVLSLLSFLMVGAAIWLFLTGAITVAGYTSLIASVWLMGGLIMLGMGVVGLYVGQVFSNVQGRPFSVVAEEVGIGS